MNKKKELGTNKLRASNHLNIRKSPSILLRQSPRSKQGLEDETSNKHLDSQKTLDGSTFRKNKNHRKLPSDTQGLLPSSSKILSKLNHPKDASLTRTDSNIVTKKRTAVKSKLFDQPTAKPSKHFKNPFEDIVMDPIGKRNNIIFALPNVDVSRDKKKKPVRPDDQGEFISMTEKEFEMEYGLDFLKFVKRQQTPPTKPPKPQYKSVLEPSSGAGHHSPKNPTLPVLTSPAQHNRSQRLKSPDILVDFKKRYNLFNKKSELYFKPLISLQQAKEEEEFFFDPNRKLKKLSVSPTHQRTLDLHLNRLRSDSKEKLVRDLILHEENKEQKPAAIARVFHPLNKRSSRPEATAIKASKPDGL